MGRARPRYAIAAAGCLGALWSMPACDDYYDPDGEFVESICDAQRIGQLRPRNDSNHAYTDGWVFVELDCPVHNAVITLETIAGAPVQGLVNVAHGGHQVRFRPSPPLAPRTTYQARLDTADGFRDWRFATSDLGDPVGTALAGRALTLHPNRGTVLDPPGLAEVVTQAVGSMYPTIQFTTDAGSATISARLGGISPEFEGDPQDPDQPVVDMTASWDDPYFRFGPVDLRWRLTGFELLLTDAVFAGALSPDGQGGGGGSLQAMWDVRPAEVAAGEAPGAYCQVAADASGGEGCVQCDDGVPACLLLLIVHMDADPWFGTLEAPQPG